MFRLITRYRSILIFLLMGMGVKEATGVAYEWTWVSGEASPLEYPAYGIKGEPASGNYPGKRQSPITWTDYSGNFWLFGGTGYDALTQQGTLNDLWKFDRGLNQWTWISGGNMVNQPGVYNTQSVYADTNCPGARKNATSWIDNAGNLCMFGGMGYGSSGTAGLLDDIWKFDPASNQWIWVKGSSSANAIIILGPEGIPSASITPGGREGPATWTDTTGTLWLFGGGGSSYTRNDLWKYAPGTNEWTLIDEGRTPAYGSQGTFNYYFWPNSRRNAASWIDTTGNLWLFGGIDGNSNSRNDLWKYDITLNQWGWIKGSMQSKQAGIYGERGIPAAANTPGARESVISWKDSAGNLCLFGGNGYSSAGNPGFLNDVWRYNPTSNQWTWMKGSNTTNQASSHGQQGEYVPENTPCARAYTASWTDSSGKLWVWGGAGYGTPESTVLMNDFWSLDPGINQWAWILGSSSISRFANYGTQGIPATTNTPGARNGMISWNDNDNNLWLFGGYHLDNSGAGGQLNDLWKYNLNSNQWIWIKGTDLTYQPGVYGNQGEADPTNSPGYRSGSVTWTDHSGFLWLFGGLGSGGTGSGGYLNDLWKYNPNSNQWMWVKGSKSPGQSGIYGTSGIPDMLNSPGCRWNAVSWIDNAGDLWLFGGYGNGDNHNSGYLNDLWKYDIETNQWIWMKGTSVVNQYGVYGIQSYPNSANCPGSRWNSSSWKDQDGNFWLFGGSGYSANSTTSRRNLLNDLWKYNPTTNQWIWMTGSDTTRQVGVYGTQDVSAPSNTPGARLGALCQTDKFGNLLLFGGEGLDTTTSTGLLNDMWKYSPTENQWAWINGSKVCNQNGIYGIKGIPALTNTPGARRYSASWKDITGNFWLFSGRVSTDGPSNLSDLWKFTPAQSGIDWEEAGHY